MKKFRFNLQTVVMLRDHRERLAKEILASYIAAHQRTVDQHRAATAHLAEASASVQSSRAGAFNPGEQAHLILGLRAAGESERAAADEVTKAAAEVSKWRDSYVVAHRNVEVIRKLETKARAHHRYESERETQNTYDDFAARRAFAPRG